ncbi:arginase family protein [Paenibacillus polymyxa]|uniref:arginase family protein n=1 Tax=Paenibacillus polymyxa TaxID=1406 RepID=UPI001BE5DF2B|nr:arginase family protein [Paenibacillus polymyxa]MBT2285063.1 arginase family protein [Paenibacillus polymyxa]
MNTTIQIIHTPTNLGLRKHSDGRERGCDKLPDTLEQLGLHSAIGAKITQRISKPEYPVEEVFDEGTLNGRQVATYSVNLANVVQKVLNADDFSLVLGGDCSVLVGSALALARKGTYGLIHIDAHPDYYHQGNREQSVVGGMALATVTGMGISLLTNVEERAPYIHAKHVLSIGYRESDPEQDIIEEATMAGISFCSAEQIRRKGLEKTTTLVQDFMLRTNKVDGYWLHLDADVLDASIMPCVDCPEPNGLYWNELEDILRTILDSNLIVGMTVAILDPDLDSVAQDVTRTFCNMLIDVLGV